MYFLPVYVRDSQTSSLELVTHHDGVVCRWVELAHKSDAKRIATMLNGEPMGMFLRAVSSVDFWF